MEVRETSRKTYKEFKQKTFREFFTDFFGSADGSDYFRTFSFSGKKYFLAAKEGRRIAGVASLQIWTKLHKLCPHCNEN